MRGDGCDGEHPHIGLALSQSPSELHSLWQVQIPMPGPPQPQR